MAWNGLIRDDDDVLTSFWCLYGSDYIYLMEQMYFIKCTKLTCTKSTIKKPERCRWTSFWCLYYQLYLYAALHLVSNLVFMLITLSMRLLVCISVINSLNCFKLLLFFCTPFFPGGIERDQLHEMGKRPIFP